MSKNLGIFVIAGAAVFVANYLVFAFQEPTAPPPNDNVPAPINVSANMQQKEGELRLVANRGDSTNRLWGQGRPNIGLRATECSRNGLKIRRSNHNAEWAAAANACPAGWWVCAAAEKNTAISGCDNGSGVGALVCGDNPQNVDDPERAWTADASSIGSDAKNEGIALKGDEASVVASKNSKQVCQRRSVWCCKR